MGKVEKVVYGCRPVTAPTIGTLKKLYLMRLYVSIVKEIMN